MQLSKIRQKININGNVIKLIALITMTIDHIGFYMLPNVELFRIIGRISFPLFAYMIAEGCRYTKNKTKYFSMIFILGVLCQTVFFVAERSLYFGVLITFSLSILLIYSIDLAKSKAKIIWWLVPIGLSLIVCCICQYLPIILAKYGFKIDYGLFGVLMPVIISLSSDLNKRTALATVSLAMLCLSLGGRQWWSMLSLIFILLYNGEKGRLNIKYLFYIYYPLHIAVIFCITELINMLKK